MNRLNMYGIQSLTRLTVAIVFAGSLNACDFQYWDHQYYTYDGGLKHEGRGYIAATKPLLVGNTEIELSFYPQGRLGKNKTGGPYRLILRSRSRSPDMEHISMTLDKFSITSSLGKQYSLLNGSSLPVVLPYIRQEFKLLGPYAVMAEHRFEPRLDLEHDADERISADFTVTVITKESKITESFSLEYYPYTRNWFGFIPISV